MTTANDIHRHPSVVPSNIHRKSESLARAWDTAFSSSNAKYLRGSEARPLPSAIRRIPKSIHENTPPDVNSCQNGKANGAPRQVSAPASVSCAESGSSHVHNL